MRKSLLISAFLLALASNARADEGMWMVNAINKALEIRMQDRGLKLSANEIYDADAPGTTVCDAVVSLDFGCSGSIISDRGLLITNHHCAYSDVHALSTPDCNYLEKGFWAIKDSEEKPIPGKSIYFLKKVLDVTDEVNKLIDEQHLEGKPMGMRKLSWILEKKYSEESGLEASLSSMWKGSRYYLALYEVYKDVRLVAAPPVCMAAFGGDIDNWEWPQHKCDFAMYRVYTGPDGKPAEYAADNIPLKSQKKLNISLKGYQPGDFTMVIGYPGVTDRYSSSAKIDYMQNVQLPVSNSLRGKQMEIISRWMDSDPVIRLIYSDKYFSLSNSQEYYAGEELCYKRFNVVGEKQSTEKELQNWIDSDPSRKEKWGSLVGDLWAGYKRAEKARRNATYFRESLIRGSKLNLIATRLNSLANELERKGPGRNTPVRAMDYDTFKGRLADDYASCDMNTEHDIFCYCVSQYLLNVDPALLGKYQSELVAGFTSEGKLDTEALTSWLWDNSVLTDPERVLKMGEELHSLDEYCSDPICRFYQDVKITDFNNAVDEAEGKPGMSALEKEYTHALYQMNLDKGQLQYPDANSTMRITYGTVGALEPYDAVLCSWRSTPAGILEKENPEVYDFKLDPRQKQLLKDASWGRWGSSMFVNFITDNDITGGNSGSPVMNAEGELIGLAFDGNKESLAGEASFTPGYNKCVCVDIRFVLWTLDKYAGMDRIISEIGI